MDSIREKIQEVFRSVFNKPDLVLTDDITTEDIEEWDSMAHISVIIALEQSFNIKFATTEIPEMQSAGAIDSIIRQKLSQ